MRHAFLLASAVALLTLFSWVCQAAEKPKYALRYSVEFLPASGSAEIEIRTKRESGRLIALDFNMPSAVYTGERGDGRVERRGNRVLWTPPRAGGAFHYRVKVDHRRANGAFDSRITANWVIARGDRLFPAAVVRATKNSGSSALLHFKLPKGWDDVETGFSKVSGGDFAVTSAERQFDRPVGWIAAGKLASTRETIAGSRITFTAPQGERTEQLAAIAVLRQALPKLRTAFGELPEKLLIVRSGDPMWRGGLSAPGSLWLHADRPLLSENGTSPLLHEMVHVVTDIRGGQADDWIAEGLAEFYSLEIARRAKLLSQARFEKALNSARRSGAQVASLRGAQSAQNRTRKAVALFADLDAELRAKGSNLDALTQLLMRRETVTLNELRIDAQKLQKQASKVLAQVR